MPPWPQIPTRFAGPRAAALVLPGGQLRDQWLVTVYTRFGF